MVERPLSMRKVRGSMPLSSTFSFSLFSLLFVNHSTKHKHTKTRALTCTSRQKYRRHRQKYRQCTLAYRFRSRPWAYSAGPPSWCLTAHKWWESCSSEWEDQTRHTFFPKRTSVSKRSPTIIMSLCSQQASCWIIWIMWLFGFPMMMSGDLSADLLMELKILPNEWSQTAKHTCSRNDLVVVVGEGLVGIRCYKLIHILVLSVLQSKILICFAHFQIVDFRIQANNDGTNILIELAEICVAELFVVVFDSIAFNIDTLQFINDASFTNNIATHEILTHSAHIYAFLLNPFCFK